MPPSPIQVEYPKTYPAHSVVKASEADMLDGLSVAASTTGTGFSGHMP